MSSAIAPMFLTFKSSGLATDQVRHLHVVYVLRPYVLRSACYVLRAEIRRPSTFYVLRSFFNVTSSKFNVLRSSTCSGVLRVLFWRSTFVFTVAAYGRLGGCLTRAMDTMKCTMLAVEATSKKGRMLGKCPTLLGDHG